MSVEYCPVCKQNKQIRGENEYMKILECGHVFLDPIYQKQIEPTLKAMSQMGKVYKQLRGFQELYASLSMLGKRLTELFANPLFIINTAIQRKDYLTAIILTVAIFEIIGKAILNENLRGKIASERLKNLTIESVIILLYGLDIIDSKAYDKITKVQRFRNENLVHVRSIETLRESLTSKELPKIARDGLDSLISLWQIFGSIKKA